MNKKPLRDYDRGLIAGLGLAIEGIDIAINQHDLNGASGRNLKEFKGCLERARQIYKDRKTS